MAEEEAEGVSKPEAEAVDASAEAEEDAAAEAILNEMEIVTTAEKQVTLLETVPCPERTKDLWNQCLSDSSKNPLAKDADSSSSMN